MSTNTWPGGHRRAMHQSDHEAWNASNYPGTRQLCVECDGETDRCEEDSIYTEEGEGPLCVECWHKTLEYLLENVERMHPYQRGRKGETQKSIES